MRYCFEALPPELCQQIFEFFTLQELLRSRLVSKLCLAHARLKIEHHASRAFFRSDRLKAVSLQELTGYIKAVRYMVAYLSQDPQILLRGPLKEALRWKDAAVVDILGTFEQLRHPIPERDYGIIHCMAVERFKVVDRDHHFIHGARSLPSESLLTNALGVFFQFVEMIKTDSCLTEKMYHNVQATLSMASAIPPQKSYRAGMLQRLRVFDNALKA
ncbi:MAG: F-box protein [Verrucomicrobia bacterium]|nr:F-box protein [Verrucomicrobiota bacterium]